MDDAAPNVDVEPIEGDEAAEPARDAAAAQQRRVDGVRHACRTRATSAVSDPTMPPGARMMTAMTPTP